MSWRLFQWGSRGPYYDTGGGVFVPEPLVDHGIQVTLFGADEAGEELLHVFHCLAVNAVPDDSDVAAVAGAVRAWCTTSTDKFIDTLPDSVTVVRVVCTSIAEVDGFQAELLINAAGTRTDPAMPSDICAVMKKAGVRAGRQYRGRFFAWPACVTDQDTLVRGAWDDAYIALLEGSYNSLLVTLGTVSYPLVIFSRAHLELNPVSAITFVNKNIHTKHTRQLDIGR